MTIYKIWGHREKLLFPIARTLGATLAHRVARWITAMSTAATLMVWVLPSAPATQDIQETRHRISAVQDDQVWIEGGLLDGLREGTEGSVFYEILVLGKKKRIVPAQVQLIRVEDGQSIGRLIETTGIVNVGYHTAFRPEPVHALLSLFLARATRALEAREYRLAHRFYSRILEALPNDPYATQMMQQTQVHLEEEAALARERKNAQYYKQVARSFLDSSDSDSVVLALRYLDKVIAVLPGDAEAVRMSREAQALLQDLGGNRAESSRRTPQIEIAAGHETPDASPVGATLPGRPADKQSVLREDRTVGASVMDLHTPADDTTTSVMQRQAQTGTASSAGRKAAEAHPETEFDHGSTTEVSAAAKGESRETSPEGMVFIEGGDTPIGTDLKSTPFYNETPRQTMWLDAFYIDRDEVTNEEYKKFCDDTSRTPPSYFVNGSYPTGAARLPVVMVSWVDADAYARWVGKRLPSEFEWEKAASGTEGRRWPWGSTWDPTRPNTRETGDRVQKVGSHPGDTSLHGLTDMAGNVSEWTADSYLPYPGNSHREEEYGEKFRVLRGGSVNVSKDFARCQFRARLPEGFRSRDLGFRCALSASTGTTEAKDLAK